MPSRDASIIIILTMHGWNSLLVAHPGVPLPPAAAATAAAAPAGQGRGCSGGLGDAGCGGQDCAAGAQPAGTHRPAERGRQVLVGWRWGGAASAGMAPQGQQRRWQCSRRGSWARSGQVMCAIPGPLTVCMPCPASHCFCCRRPAEEGGGALPGVWCLTAAAGGPERHRLPRR